MASPSSSEGDDTLHPLQPPSHALQHSLLDPAGSRSVTTAPAPPSAPPDAPAPEDTIRRLLTELLTLKPTDDQAANTLREGLREQANSVRDNKQRRLKELRAERKREILLRELKDDAEFREAEVLIDVKEIDSVYNRIDVFPRQLPDCYEEVKTLLMIERNPIYAKALEEWSRKEKLFTSRVERKKNQVANLKNEVYQLIGFFSVFQGVLLTAVSQANLLRCSNSWSPILLSVVASIATIGGVFLKSRVIKDLRRTITSEERALKVCDISFDPNFFF